MTKIEQQLLNDGIKPQSQGFRYLCCSIELIMKHPDLKIGHVRSIVARQFYTTASRVDRAIGYQCGLINEKQAEYIYTAAIKLRE